MHWRLAALLLLGVSLASCGLGVNDIGEPLVPGEATTLVEPTLDPRIQTTSLPQQGSD